MKIAGFVRAVRWFVVIKSVRFLCAIHLVGVADWLAEYTGLVARLRDLLGDRSPG